MAYSDFTLESVVQTFQLEIIELSEEGTISHCRDILVEFREHFEQRISGISTLMLEGLTR